MKQKSVTDITRINNNVCYNNTLYLYHHSTYVIVTVIKGSFREKM